MTFWKWTLIGWLATAASAQAQGLVQGPVGRSGPAGTIGSNSSGQGGLGCVQAVGTAAKDCVLGYGGSLAACASMGGRAPGGTLGKSFAAGACLMHGLDAVQCVESVGKAVAVCQPNRVDRTSPVRAQACGRPGGDRASGGNSCGRSGRDSACARELAGLAR